MTGHDATVDRTDRLSGTHTSAHAKDRHCGGPCDMMGPGIGMKPVPRREIAIPD